MARIKSPSLQSNPFLTMVQARRSNYTLTDRCTLTLAELHMLIETAVMHSPTSFNLQEGRVVLLTGEAHEWVWDMVFEEQISAGPSEAARVAHQFNTTSAKAAHGTILFFFDEDVVKGWAATMPSIAEHFMTWTSNSAGMLQYVIWVALSEEGMGANLQHYSSTSSRIEGRLRERLHLPDSWRSTGMMPFGVARGPPRLKGFVPIEDRVRYVGDLPGGL